MYAPVTLAQEEAPALICLDGAAPPDLDALDFAILQRWTAHNTWTGIAKDLDVSVQTVRLRVARPVFQQTLARLQKSWFDQLARGEYGVLAFVKANLLGNVKRLQALARVSPSETVKYNALVKLVEWGGMQAPKPAVVEAPERLLDLMTPDELDHFARFNEFPRRLQDQIAKLAAGVLQARQQTTVEADVIEWESAGPAPLTDEPQPQPVHAPAPEPVPVVPDDPPEVPDDGPHWGGGPEELEVDEEHEAS